MIGTHSVMAYANPYADQWSPTLVSNPDFAGSMAGWAQGPFEQPWTWSTEQITANSDRSLIRLPASVPLRPAVIETVRTRVTFSVDAQAAVWARVHYGKNQEGAAYGPFWRPNDAIENWAARIVEPGTHTVEFTYSPPAGYEDYPYIAPSWAWNQNYTTPPGTPPITGITVHYADLTYLSGGSQADISCWVDEIAINHGRSDSGGQPEASSATLDFTARPENPLPAFLDVGSVITVTTRLPDTGTGAVESTRFTGRVSDINMGWDDEGEDTPDAGTGQIVAMGVLAELGRQIVGAEPFPQELDGARVARIMGLAGFTLNPSFSDPGTVQILPRDIDSRSALEVATDTAQSAGGIVWATRNGEVRYADADHRRNTAYAFTLDSCDLLVTPVWVRNMAGLVNEVSIGYGVSGDEGGEQPRYVARDDSSRAKWGRFSYSTATELAALADAQAMAQLLLTRNKQPVWVMAALPVDMAGLDPARTGDLLRSDMHTLIQLTGLPSAGLAPTQFPAWIEGWTERLGWGIHEIELVISGYCRTAPPPRWNDIPSALTWDAVGPAMTWDEAACLGPSLSEGRWDDVSASLRWDQVDPAITWDSWNA